jgi:site-specific DNA recombinase
MSTGSYSAEEVRKWINQKGVKITKQVFLNTLRNPVYIGKIRIKPYMDEPQHIVEGLHPAIIDPETFYRANEVLEGRVRNMKFHEDKTDIYPLKGFMTCPIHNTSITAYGARGRLGELHHYYLCVKSKECGQRHRIEDVHQSVEDILSKIQVSAQTVMLYKSMLKKFFEKNDYIRLDEITRTEKEIEKIKERITNLQDQFMDGNISSNDFHPMKERTEKTLTGLELKLKNLKQTTSPFKTFINKEVPMLENLSEYYKNADGKTKKKILGCIFSEKLVLEKGKVATYKFTKPIEVLLNASKVFKKSGTKKEVENDLLSCVAPQVGLEPTTYGLTVRRSNQLSY